MATANYDATTSFGNKIALLGAKAAELAGEAKRLVDAMGATANEGGGGFQASRIAANADFGAADATAAQALYDGCNGLYLAVTTGDAPTAISKIDKGA